MRALVAFTALVLTSGCFVGNDLVFDKHDAGTSGSDAGDGESDASVKDDAGVLPSLLVTVDAGATAQGTTYTFDDRLENTRGPAVTFTVTNTSTRDITVPAEALQVASGPPVEFEFTRTPTLPLTLHPGDQFTFDVVFEPIDLDVRSAKLTLSSNAIPPQLTLRLEGRGAAAPPPVGKPLFVAGGDSMVRYTSPDGQNFTLAGFDPDCPAGNPCDNYIHELAIGAGKIIAVGAGVSNRGNGLGTRSLWSTDGVSWKEFTGTNAPAGPANAVAYDSGRFVLVQGGTSYRSPDGTSWEKASGAVGVTHGSVFGGRGRFVLVGDNNAQGGVSRITDDGLSWSGSQSGGLSDGGTVIPREFGAYGRGVYVAAQPCLFGSRSVIFWSYDGVDWREGWSNTGSCVGGLAFLEHQYFLAVANDTTVTSTDGIHWVAVPYTPGKAPTAAGPLAVAPGLDGGQPTWVIASGSNIEASHDGLSWTRVLSNAQKGLGAVTYGVVAP